MAIPKLRASLADPTKTGKTADLTTIAMLTLSINPVAAQMPTSSPAIRNGIRAAGIAVMTCQFAPLAMCESTVWPPATGVPVTRWGKDISFKQAVWPEYPRPQLVRNPWLNLNGAWDYAIVPRGGTCPETYPGKILVPFPVESVLSQVAKRVDENSSLIYHRTFEIPPAWRGQRVLLHFGAVDWETAVTLNGKPLGTHRGGYDAFDFDISDALKPGGPQDLVVSVWDPTEAGQPRGKQARNPAGIFYTPSTGIWQTVWLEPVPPAHIEKLRMVPDVDASRLTLTVVMGGPAGAAQSVEAVVMDAGKEVARATGAPGQVLSIAIPKAKLWWPEVPFLYDLKVTLKQGPTVVDAVTSYFGMRKISLGPDANGNARILLNNQFVFQNGFLDQGFWPDGLYTPPSDEALRYDIEMTKMLGFNLLRKHIKVESDRWYYWADKLGMLVWQDMPSSSEMAFGWKKGYVENIDGIYELELRRMIQGRFNHPSIIMWVTFNEGWGLTGEKHRLAEQESLIVRAREVRMVDAARQEDPTRLINAESGTGSSGKEGLLDFGLGDIIDFHAYAQQIPVPDKNRAAVIGEYGWGASAESRAPDFLKMLDQKGNSAIVLTQLTDVETESNNGRMKYDRTLKGDIPAEEVGPKLINAIHQAGYLNYPGSAMVRPTHE